MVGEPADIVVSELEIPDANLAKLARHGVKPNDVLEVLANEPDFFTNLPGRSGSHVMLGPRQDGRFVYVVLIESLIRGVWTADNGLSI